MGVIQCLSISFIYIRLGRTFFANFKKEPFAKTGKWDWSVRELGMMGIPLNYALVAETLHLGARMVQSVKENIIFSERSLSALNDTSWSCAQFLLWVTC